MAYLLVLEKIQSKPIPYVHVGAVYTAARAPPESAVAVHDALMRAGFPAYTLYFGNQSGRFTALILEDSQKPRGIDNLTEVEVNSLTPEQRRALDNQQEARKREFTISLNEKLAEVMPRGLRHHVDECKFPTSDYTPEQIQRDLEEQAAIMVIGNGARLWIGRRTEISE